QTSSRATAIFYVLTVVDVIIIAVSIFIPHLGIPLKFAVTTNDDVDRGLYLFSGLLIVGVLTAIIGLLTVFRGVRGTYRRYILPGVCLFLAGSIVTAYYLFFLVALIGLAMCLSPEQCI